MVEKCEKDNIENKENDPGLMNRQSSALPPKYLK